MHRSRSFELVMLFLGMLWLADLIFSFYLLLRTTGGNILQAVFVLGLIILAFLAMVLIFAGVFWLLKFWLVKSKVIDP